MKHLKCILLYLGVCFSRLLAHIIKIRRKHKHLPLHVYGSMGKVDRVTVATLTSSNDFSFSSIIQKLARLVFVEEKNMDKQKQEVSVPKTLC